MWLNGENQENTNSAKVEDQVNAGGTLNISETFTLKISVSGVLLFYVIIVP